MSKYLLGGIMMLSALSASADYNFMQFNYADGTKKTLSTDGLTILIDEGTLKISNSKGENINMVAMDLVSMQFTDGGAGVKSLTDINGSVEAYSASGVFAGKFESVKEAYDSLPEGIYLLKTSEGNSIKIIVNK